MTGIQIPMDDMYPLVGKPFPKSFSYGKPDKTKEVASYGKIKDVVGKGGFGDIYKLDLHPYHPVAKHLGYAVAVKIVGRKTLESKAGGLRDELVKRFAREGEIGRALASLEGGEAHPNLLRYGEYGLTDENDLFLIMEYVPDARPLSNFIVEEKEERLPIREAFSIMARITDAVEYAHTRNVAHRDIQPANILIAKNGLEKLIDFGIGKFEGEEEKGPQLSRGDTLLGTPDYMSPECADLKIGYNKERDVWGICAVLYALIAGHPPFGSAGSDGEIDALLSKIKGLNKQDRAHLLKKVRDDTPWEISDLCDEGLLKDPKLRINALELNREFKRIAKRLGINI